MHWGLDSTYIRCRISSRCYPILRIKVYVKFWQDLSILLLQFANLILNLKGTYGNMKTMARVCICVTGQKNPKSLLIVELSRA